MKKILETDYYKVHKLSDIQVSKSYVAWIETIPEDEKNYKSNIFVYSKTNKLLRRFTRGEGDKHPRISPDEKFIAFLSKRNGTNQIFQIPLDGGEAELLCKSTTDITEFEWSPDGKKIGFVSRVDTTWKEEKGSGRLNEEIYTLKKKNHEEMKRDPRVITRIRYRTGVSYLDESSFSQLFVHEVNGDTLQVSEGNYNYLNITWFDNDHILSVAKREEPIDISETSQLIMFDISMKSTGEVILSYSKLYFPGKPVSDGGKIFINYDHKRKTPGLNTVWGQLVENELQPINLDLDRSISNLKIRDDRILCMIEDRGKTDVREYITENDEFQTLIRPEASILSFDSDGEEIYYIGTSPTHPSCIWHFDGNSTDILYDPNYDWLNGKTICEPEEFWLENPEGVKFQGWFFAANGEKPPLILSIHGGPHVMWTNAGSMWHEWQVSVARGYSILAVNPIGSSGYGEQFSQLITGRWGIEDARDLIQAVYHVLPRVDESRIYLTGGSYAGFQVANIIGRYNLFRAACAQRGVYNLSTFWSTTDIPLFGFYETTTTPWENLDLLWELSPLSRVQNIETPLLLIHSENDFRVSISQVEELFASLKYFDKKVEFIRYPNDGHELSRSGEPQHVVDRITRMIEFFDRH